MRRACEIQNMTKTVLVTGVTGFIAGHVVHELLSRGYIVRGTVRGMAKAEKLKALYANLGHNPSNFELVALDLESDEGWADAMADCIAVQHIASPFPMEEPDDKMALVPAAKGGALRVLNHARNAGVPKVVLTSSTVSITNGVKNPPDYVFTEADWSNTDAADIRAYALSKTLAEKAAWDDVEKHGGPILTVMNPSFVVGPLLDDTISTSGTLIKQFFDGKFPAVPELCFGIVDVRDVAKAHVNAMERDTANGKRYLLSAGTMKMIDIAETLKQAFPERGKKLPKFQSPAWLVRILSVFNKSVRGILPEVGRMYQVDGTRAREELDIDFITRKDALIALGNSLIERKMV
jgi:dihydroflavonol-4-reductase